MGPPQVTMSTHNAHETLAIILAAKPVCEDEMFPDYHDAEELCRAMATSLAKWTDTLFVDSAMQAFLRGDARKGMQFAREKVYFYLPDECDWKYMDD